MRKYVRKEAGILAAVALAASMTACSGSAEDNSGAPAQENAGEENAADSEGTADRKVLRVAMECAYAPYNWTQADDSNGAVPIADSNEYAYGYDVMMAKKICEELGWDLEIVRLDWDSLVPAVQSGQADCAIAGQSITSERLEAVDFTEPYYYATIVTLVKADGPYADAASVADLAGATCTSQMSTIWYDTCLPQIPDANILYTTSENFTNDMVSFLAQKNMEEFHNKYRTVDVLLIDDVQFLQNKMGFQEEFFHTFNALTQVGKQVILTSDRPPREIDTLTDRLRNRFESGLLADIQPPDIETRMAIVKKKAQQFQMELSPQIVEYVAEKLKNNIRQLEGAVKKIFAMSSLTGNAPTIDMAEEAIRDVQTDNMPVGVKTEKIIEYIANFYGITPADITSNKKNANIALARQVTVYVLREITGQTLQMIGEAIGGKNHSTINYSISLVEKKMRNEPSFKNTVFEIINNLQE